MKLFRIKVSVFNLDNIDWRYIMNHDNTTEKLGLI